MPVEPYIRAWNEFREFEWDEFTTDHWDTFIPSRDQPTMMVMQTELFVPTEESIHAPHIKVETDGTSS